MKTQPIFAERQRFTQWWLWVLLAGINGLVIYGAVYQLSTGKPFGNNPASDGVLIWTVVFSLSITALFFVFKLETKISKEGVEVRFFPLRRKFKLYPWSSVAKAYTRTYSPIREYGGWGVRYRFSGNGKALNVSGNRGLQLVMHDGSELLIGTQRQQEIDAILSKLKVPGI